MFLHTRADCCRPAKKAAYSLHVEMLNTEDVALEVRMKTKKLIGITTMALSVMVLLPVRLNAEQHGGRRNQRRYKFVDVGTFGGPQSYINAAFISGAPNQINRHGTAVGAATTTIPITSDSNLSFCGGDNGLVPFVTHAFKWQDGVTTDLGGASGS